MASESMEIKLDVIDAEIRNNNSSNDVKGPHNHVPIHLKFNNLSVKANEKVILQDVSGEFLPGELVAIMGPSGAGKSTLLNFLAGRSKGMDLVNGEITMNGKKATKTLRRKIGYVLQEDVFFSHLTVSETLKFVGDIRLPDSMKKDDKYKIVDEVIDELGLRKCAKTIMGGGIFEKGCSGGEKKRCSIAIELITNPSLLMMDEPTSGLDSSTAFNLIQSVKNLAKREKRTIATTVHQPSSHVFHMFDKLVLISEGKVAYFGKTEEVLDFFEYVGSPCYPNWNPADFIMEMLTIESELKNTIADKFVEYKRKHAIAESSYGNLKTNGILNGGFTGSRENIESLEQPNGFTQANEDCKEDKIKLARWPTGFSTQFKALCKRSFIQSKQNLLDKLSMAQLLGLTLIVSLLWFNTPYDETSIPDRQGSMFFVLIYLSLNPMFYSIFIFPTEREVIQKERSAGMYRLSAYYFAKLVSELPALVLQPITMHLITYWVTGLNRSPYYLVSLIGILTSSFLAQSIGLLIGASVSHFKRALTTAAIVGLGAMLMGGFYTKRVPDWMNWAKYVSHVSYGFNILLRVEFQHATRTFNCAKDSIYDVCLSNTTTVLTGQDILPNAVTLDVGIAESFVVLWAMIIILRVLFYIVLRYKNKPN